MEIKRDVYLNRLASGRGNGMIKIVTGLRRCGKSYLLFKLFYDFLVAEGVEETNIIRIAMDDVRNEKFLNAIELVNHIELLISGKGLCYILLDEVQMMDNFTGALNTLLRFPNVEIYTTGSNSKFLSNDIATEFRGRGDEIHMFPLSFAEYMSVCTDDKPQAWKDYTTFGGLPQIVSIKENSAKIQFLKNIFNSVYIKDLVERNRIKKDGDFEALIRIMSSSIGSPCNPNKLSDTFKSVAHSDLHANTVLAYLNYMQDAFLLEKATRYDIKGKKYIGSLYKYYFSDMGIRNAVLDFRQQEESLIMENVIYNELRMRGYLVDVGMVEVRKKESDTIRRKQLEIDFVVNDGSKRYYIQSALAIPDSEKMAQECASLWSIHNTFKKIVIVKDNIHPWYTEEGILVMGLFDFLSDPKSLNY